MTRETVSTPDGHCIEYELVEPGGAPRGHLVFLMGLGNLSGMWEAQRAHFREHYALLFVELRGVGRSGAPSGWWGVGALADDVLFVLGRACAHWPPGVALVGHSMGGMVAYEVLARAPALVGSLALLSAGRLQPARGGLGVRLGGACGFLSLLAAAGPRERIDALLRLNYPAGWLSQPATDGGDDGVWGGELNEDAVMRMLMRAARGRGIVPVWTWLKQTAAYVAYRPSAPPAAHGPVLAVFGDRDELHAVSTLRASAEALGAKVVLLPGVGHYCFSQAAAAVNDALERFVDGVAGADGGGVGGGSGTACESEGTVP